MDRRRFLATSLGGGRRSACRRGELVNNAPKIALLYDPFETGEAQRFASPEKF